MSVAHVCCSHDEDWVPPDQDADGYDPTMPGWGGGTRSRPIATRYPTRARRLLPSVAVYRCVLWRCFSLSAGRVWHPGLALIVCE